MTHADRAAGRRIRAVRSTTPACAGYPPIRIRTGHIHQAPFRNGGSWADRIGSTWVFNAGRQIGPSPTHVIVDLAAQHAKWFSLAGNEIVRLDRSTVEREPLNPD